MLKQSDPNRLEEYITLREELLQLLAHTRLILYWTIVLIIAGLAWQVTQQPPFRVPISAFTGFLYLILLVSCLVYVINAGQVHRIGAYIAIFWDSERSDMHLTWHRFNRGGPAGGFSHDSATVVYTFAAFVLLMFFTLSFATQQTTRSEPVLFMILMGISEMMMFSQLSSYLRSRRSRFEEEWRRISEAPELQNDIHDRYEMPPSRVIAPY